MSEEEINALKEQINSIISEGRTKLGELTTIANSAAEKEKEIADANTKILDLQNKSESSNNSINGKVQKAIDLLNQIITKQKEIDNHYNEFIAKPNENELSKLDKINSTYQKILDNSEASSGTAAKLKELELNLLGNKETNTVGLKEIFDTHDSEIKDKKKEWEEIYTSLYKKIEGLLPGATSTGLASAYQEQRKEYVKPYWIWSIAFTLITGGMILFAIMSLHNSNTFAEAFTTIISRTPFFVPAIWLAVFTSKQQSQNKRLQEEYIYKETLSKSYEAYKREIEKLPDTSEKTKLIEKLMETMVKMADYNPSQTLHMRHHNDKPPFFEGLFNRKKETNQEK